MIDKESILNPVNEAIKSLQAESDKIEVAKSEIATDKAKLKARAEKLDEKEQLANKKVEDCIPSDQIKDREEKVVIKENELKAKELELSKKESDLVIKNNQLVEVQNNLDQREIALREGEKKLSEEKETYKETLKKEFLDDLAKKLPQ